MSDNGIGSVIDTEQLASLAEAAGVETVKIILDAFWASNDTLAADLNTSIAAANFDEITKTAHALKGSAANVGATQLSDCAKAIEQGARDQNIMAIQQQYSTLDTAIAAARSAFDTLLDRLAA